MTPERWRRIEDLFDAGLRVAPAGRAAWLRAIPEVDDGLRDEVGRLLDLDERSEGDGFLSPPGPVAPSPTTAWPEAAGAADLGEADDPGVFSPRDAIAEGSGRYPASESRPVVRARLRELPLLVIVIEGVTLCWMHAVLGVDDPAVDVAGAVAAAGLAGVSAYLSGPRPVSMAALRALELGMTGLLAGLLAFFQYRLMLAFSLRDDTMLAQLTLKNVVLLTGILILTYSLYVPKGSRRAAAVAVPLALLPFATLLVLAGRHPEALAWLGRGWRKSPMARAWLYTFDALILLSLAAGSAFGARTISRLRRQVAEARQLGQYRLRRRVGSGGMGEVYLAEHQLLKRPCALKLIRPGQEVDPRALDRFEREVRLTATLSHPNTVEIYDYGRTEEGTYYYVMEYLPGLSLAELVERHGPLPPGRAVYLLRQACGALREAHGAGLIHRDIKPSNILAARRGGMDDVAKLLDFGLVRPPSAGPAPHLSDEGQVLGTPLFMSPEQAAGAPELDGRSDIYSLGAVAYYLLTGRPPFEAGPGGGLGLLIAHARDPVAPPSTLLDGIPGDLEAVVLRCLAKAPADRFPDAASLERALAGSGCAGDWDQDRAARWWRDSGEAPGDR